MTHTPKQIAKLLEEYTALEEAFLPTLDLDFLYLVDVSALQYLFIQSMPKQHENFSFFIEIFAVRARMLKDKLGLKA